MTESTKITYDVSDAISKLQKLNRAVGEAADTVVRELGDKASGGLDKFVDGLSDISPVAGDVVGKVRNLVGSLGPMGLVAGTAAAGLAAVASNLFDLPSLLEDSAGGMDAFGEAVDRQFRIFEKFGDINDAIGQAENRRALRSLSLKQAEIAQEQIKINELRTAAQTELQLAQQTLREKERQVQDSVRKRLDLEKQLQRDSNENRVRQVESGALKSERAVGDLSAAAQKAALEGNVDLAKDLRDRAQEIADELGGHVFYQKQVESATAAINQQMETQLANQKRVEASSQNEIAAARALVAERQRELDILKERERVLRNETKGVRAERRLVSERETQRRNTDRADTGAGEVIAGIAKIRQEFEIGGRSAAENIKDSLRLSLGGLTSKARIDAGVSTERDALKIIEQVSKTLLKPGGVTPQEVSDIRPLVEKIGALTGALEVAKGQGTLNSGQERGLSQLQRFLADFQQIATGTEKFVSADRSADQVIQRESAADTTIQAFNQRIDAVGTGVNTLNEAATKAADSLNRIANPQIAPSSVPTVQQPNRPQNPQIQQAPTTINVNANVKGGIIDREVTEAITDIIRRELRKQTGNTPTQ